MARQGIMAGLPVSRLEPGQPDWPICSWWPQRDCDEGDIASFVRALEEAL
jgi:hypothetical protein